MGVRLPITGTCEARPSNTWCIFRLKSAHLTRNVYCTFWLRRRRCFTILFVVEWCHCRDLFWRKILGLANLLIMITKGLSQTPTCRKWLIYCFKKWQQNSCGATWGHRPITFSPCGNRPGPQWSRRLCIVDKFGGKITCQRKPTWTRSQAVAGIADCTAWVAQQTI